MAKTKKRSASHKPVVTGNGWNIGDLGFTYGAGDLEYDLSIDPAPVAGKVWLWAGLSTQTPTVRKVNPFSQGDAFLSDTAHIGGDASSTGTAWIEIRSVTGELILRSDPQEFST